MLCWSFSSAHQTDKYIQYIVFKVKDIVLKSGKVIPADVLIVGIGE